MTVLTGKTLAAIAFIYMAGPAQAQMAAPAQSQEGRYSMRQTNDGLLRLDTQTGMVSHCRQSGGAWACTTVTDDYVGLRKRLLRLEKENEALRARLSELEKSGPVKGPYSSRKKNALPSDEEIDRIMGFFEKLMRRFHGMVRRFKNDLPEQEL